MRVWLAACGKQACQKMDDLIEIWRRERPEDELVTAVKCRFLPERSISGSLAEMTREEFGKSDALIFFGAAGIAVRCIAPCISHKSTDPAVLEVDEAGRFCIPLLSGHMGGANELARWAAKKLGAMPVITTATDLEGRFAVDDFARKNGLVLTDWNAAKEISVRILEGEHIGIWTDLPLEGELPEELWLAQNRREAKIWICDRILEGETLILQLIPRTILVGIGCRKNTAKEQIGTAVEECLDLAGVRKEAVRAFASIDLKKEEAGICDYCRERNIPFWTFSKEELEAVQGSKAGSDFVREITGVDNVCERSAIAAGGNLFFEKRICGGVTIALARRKGSVRF